MRLSGLKITASTVERYIVNDGDYCPIPSGFSESDCTFLISGVAGSWSEYWDNRPDNTYFTYDRYKDIKQKFTYKLEDSITAKSRSNDMMDWTIYSFSLKGLMNGRQVIAFDSEAPIQGGWPYNGKYYIYKHYSLYVTVIAMKK